MMTIDRATSEIRKRKTEDINDCHKTEWPDWQVWCRPSIAKGRYSQIWGHYSQVLYRVRHMVRVRNLAIAVLGYIADRNWQM